MNAQPHDTRTAADGRTNGSGTNGNGHYRSSMSGTAAATGASGASVGHLLKELLHEGTSMLTNEVALAKSEARETMRTTKEGAAAVGSGGAVALSGFIILLLGAVYGLSNVMAPWLAAVIVGGVVTFAGLAMVQAGKKKFRSESLRPEHTMHSLHKDKEAIRGRMQ